MYHYNHNKKLKNHKKIAVKVKDHKKDQIFNEKIESLNKKIKQLENQIDTLSHNEKCLDQKIKGYIWWQNNPNGKLDFEVKSRVYCEFFYIYFSEPEERIKKYKLPLLIEVGEFRNYCAEKIDNIVKIKDNKKNVVIIIDLIKDSIINIKDLGM